MKERKGFSGRIINASLVICEYITRAGFSFEKWTGSQKLRENIGLF